MHRLLIKICERYGSFFILSLLVVVTLMLLAKPILGIPATIPKNYNEGWNAFQAMHAFSDRPLYPNLKALTSNNYPPLSFYIVGSLGLLVGDNIIAGRIIAFVSLLIIATNIGLIVQRIGKSSLIALFSAFVFLAYMAGHHYEYIGMNDPQMLAHAIQLTGFLVFLTSNQTGGLLINWGGAHPCFLNVG